jgi:hypothetical protein
MHVSWIRKRFESVPFSVAAAMSGENERAEGEGVERVVTTVKDHITTGDLLDIDHTVRVGRANALESLNWGFSAHVLDMPEKDALEELANNYQWKMDTRKWRSFCRLLLLNIECDYGEPLVQDDDDDYGDLDEEGYRPWVELFPARAPEQS